MLVTLNMEWNGIAFIRPFCLYPSVHTTKSMWKMCVNSIFMRVLPTLCQLYIAAWCGRKCMQTTQCATMTVIENHKNRFYFLSVVCDFGLIFLIAQLHNWWWLDKHSNIQTKLTIKRLVLIAHAVHKRRLLLYYCSM